MATVTAQAKLYNGFRLLCVDKNINASLNAPTTVTANNTRIRRTVVDTEVTATLGIVDERYKTYGGQLLATTSSTLRCKFPTYVRFDVEALGVPEGIDIIVQMEEGFAIEGNYAGSGFKPLPKVSNLLQFRTPKKGVGILTSSFSTASTIRWIRPGTALIGASADILAIGILNPGKIAAIVNGLFGLQSIIGMIKQFEAEYGSETTVSAIIGRLLSAESAVNSEFNITNAVTGFLESADIDLDNQTQWFLDSDLSRLRFGSLSAQLTTEFSNTARRFRSTPTTMTSQTNLISISPDALLTWGTYNDNLGNFTETYLSPSIVGTEADWKSVSVGQSWQLAIRSFQNTLWSWGYNTSGVTGQGTSSGITAVPTQIGTSTNWLKVSTNPDSFHAMAIKADGPGYGTLWAWGANNVGQLGLGDTATRLVPTQVGTAGDWVDVVCGGSFTVAINTSGEIYSCGTNANGRTGQGTTSGSITTLTKIGTANDWAKISAGFRHTLAVKTNGELWGWGYNEYRQLAPSELLTVTAPVRLGSASDWQYAVASAGHSVAIKTTGTLWAWGLNNSGQTGQSIVGDPIATTTTISQIGSATNWTNISASSSNTYALNSSNELYGVGDNSLAQLGTGTTSTTPVITPVRIGSQSFKAVHAGDSRAFGIAK